MIDILPGFAKKILGIKSPSTVFREIGEFTMKGLAQGIIATAPQVHMSLGRALKTMVDQTGDAKELGKYLGKEFMTGMSGAVDPRSAAHQRIDSAFQGLRDKLKEQTGKLKEQLAEDKQKLKDELAKDNPSQVAIQSLAADVRDQTALLRTARQASASLMANLEDEKRRMIRLAASYDQVGLDLEEAQKTLEKVTQARDQFITQYSQLPDIGSLFDEAFREAQMTADEKLEAEKKKREEDDKKRQIDRVALYKKAMEEQIKATQKYAETLKALQALNLDKTTYDKLVKEGVKGQDFADQLLKGGQKAVDEINALDAKLLESATTIANQATEKMYDVGVNAAQGIVDGLKQRQADIQGQMDQIAASMVRSIKRQLGIRSPSRVMAEVGRFTAQGVIQGLQMSSRAVADAAASIGDDAAGAMSGSLRNISDLLGSEIDTDLTITPVMDLTQVRRDAQSLSGLVSDSTITAATSAGQASAVSQEVSASQAAAADASTATTFNFEQNNYSPEALSDVEIYRQTKNQLGQLKSVLGVPT